MPAPLGRQRELDREGLSAFWWVQEYIGRNIENFPK